ncbi:hypothetical protein [Vulcaniibacterium tengchongense]|uniref:Uncharacterized protein n=1 Tax=Vulcaniibacterium tengchongense TaxID=1273429 RepID=A0A3N4UZ83_9GAMM|nr:hypothetical protein [Vulcaniibacterium tengchongense]RPE75458.1 hypothetical protein EDC50_2903 [Vulcaniibacterium tengchongense]
MEFRRGRPLAWAILSLLGLGGLSPPAFAQSANVQSASTSTCNIKGRVTLTIAGIRSEVPLTCVNPTGQSAPGSDASALASTTALGIPAIANLASVSAPFGESAWKNSPGTTMLIGDAGASDVALLQDGVSTADVAGRIDCVSTTGSAIVDCAAAMAIGALHIGGQEVDLPPEPIPINTVVPIANLDLAVALPLVGTIAVPINGAVTLNRVEVTGQDSNNPRIEHAPISVSASGSVDVLGVGLVGVDIRLDDYTDMKITWRSDAGPVAITLRPAPYESLEVVEIPGATSQ